VTSAADFLLSCIGIAWRAQHGVSGGQLIAFCVGLERAVSGDQRGCFFITPSRSLRQVFVDDNPTSQQMLFSRFTSTCVVAR